MYSTLIWPGLVTYKQIDMAKSTQLVLQIRQEQICINFVVSI